MNNLSQTQYDAKQASLDNQQAQMLVTYQNTDSTEQAAIIRHIDSFLKIVSEDAKIFWLDFRQKLEKLSE